MAQIYFGNRVGMLSQIMRGKPTGEVVSAECYVPSAFIRCSPAPQSEGLGAGPSDEVKGVGLPR